MGRDVATAVTDAGLSAAVTDEYLAAVVPQGLAPPQLARARAEAEAFLAILVRHVGGDPVALGEIQTWQRRVAFEVVQRGGDPGVLIDRFDAGRHVIVTALAGGGRTATEIAAADDRLRVAQQAMRTAIRDAVAHDEHVVDQAVAEVTAAIEAGSTPDDVMHVAAGALCRLVEADRARAWLDIGGQRLELVASAGSVSPMGFFVSSERGLLADILNAGGPVRQCPVDAEQWEAAVPNLPIPGAALFVPMAAPGRTFGLLYALRNDPVPFSESAERVAVRFVERVEPALAWALQMRALQRWASASQDFLRITTHELRRPLTVLRGYLEMLDAVGPDDAAMFRERMSRAADQLAELLTGITDTVTLEDPARPLTLTRVTLGELVEAVLAGARDEAEQQRASLQVEVDDPDTEVQCDVDNVAHAMANRLSNAFRHTAERRRVWLRAGPEGSRFVRLSVRDEGSGVSPGDEQKVFLKYFRSEETRRSGSPGSGLGLYFVRLVAERHGGRVAVENPPEGGACFSLELPLEPGMVAWSI